MSEVLPEYKKYFIEVAYNGKDFHGFQAQKNADRTVQALLNSALSALLQEPIKTTSSSRTDAGVHAKQNFASFETAKNILPGTVRKLNFILPMDLEVKRIIPVDFKAHPRYDAISRYYEYYISYHKNIFTQQFVCFYPYKKLDIEVLNKVATYYKTKTDYTSFSKKNTDVKTRTCQIEISEWEWREKEELLVYKVKSDRFLRGMVRAMVQTAVQVSRGNIKFEDLDEIFAKGDNRKTDFSAPANGLCLLEVNYPEGYFK
jgi:tRNA pseudouridine38-40 synthase